MAIITVLFLVAAFPSSLADMGVPVLLWKSITCDAVLPELQGFPSIGQKNQLHSLLNTIDAETKIIFLMNELNVEDFSGHPDTLPKLQHEFESSKHVFTPSMPSLSVERLTCCPITVNISDPSSVRLADDSLETLLLVPLGDRPAADRRATLRQVDNAIGEVLDRVKRLTQNYAAVLTGRYSSMGRNVKTRSSRSLKAATPDMPSAEKKHMFLNFGCVLLYTSDSPVIHFQSAKERQGQQPLLLHLGAPSSNTSNCNGSDVNTVTLTWQHSNGTSIDLTDVTLNLSFKAKMTRPGSSDMSSWTLQNVTLSYSGKVDDKSITKAEVEIDFDDVYAPRHFSYHCTNRLWAAEPTANGTDIDGPMLTALQLPGFQVQAFLPPGSAARFGRPWDCTTLFTIPILSGLFVSLLMLLILFISLMMLANVRATDRFDDPHGRLLLAHLPGNE